MSLNVIDIGKDQAGINLAAVPCDAVIVGVCDAFTNNPYADQQYQGARAAGRRVGVYQFYRNNPAEADYFVAQTRGYVGQAVFIVDAETDGGPAMVGAVLEAGNRVLAGTGVRPWLYVPPNLLNLYNWQPCVDAGFALWLPAYVAGYTPIYGFNPPNGLLPPKWWGQCAAWQFTSTGRLPGWNGNIDLSIFAGPGAAWDAFTQQEDTLTAADVAAINAHTDAQILALHNYVAALLVGTYTLPDPITGAPVTHAGSALVVEENQRRINAANAGLVTANAALAKAATVTPAPAPAPAPAPGAVTLTDAQAQQIAAASLAAVKTQWNK
jgi:lysozyme